MIQYKVLNGISLPGGKRCEVGDIIDQDVVPAGDRGWLRTQGYIEIVEASESTTETSTPKTKAAKKRASR